MGSAMGTPASTSASADDLAERDPELLRRAAQLKYEMSRAPAGSRQRRFLRRAAERAAERANAPGLTPGALGSPRP